jgi:hypothetical protein
MRQQPPLAIEAAAVPGQRAIRPDDAMTWDDHRHRIRSAGHPDGAAGPRVADVPRQLAVGHGRACRDLSQRRPDELLKRCPGGLDGHVVQRLEAAFEILLSR